MAAAEHVAGLREQQNTRITANQTMSESSYQGKGSLAEIHVFVGSEG
jgi:hypothetical protein